MPPDGLPPGWDYAGEAPAPAGLPSGWRYADAPAPASGGLPQGWRYADPPVAPPASWAGDTGGAPEPPASDLQGNADNGGWGTSNAVPTIGAGMARGTVQGAADIAAGIPQAVAGSASGLRHAQATAGAEMATPGNNITALLQRDQGAQARADFTAANAPPGAPGPIEPWRTGYRGRNPPRRPMGVTPSSRRSASPSPLVNQVGSAAGSVLPLLGTMAAGTMAAGPVGGVMAAMGASGAQTYEQTYAQLRKQGATPAAAHRGAVAPAVVSAAVMTLPAGELLGKLTPEIQQPVLAWAAHVAASSGTMVGFQAVQQAATNVATGRPIAEGITPASLAASAIVGAGMGAMTPRAGAETPEQRTPPPPPRIRPPAHRCPQSQPRSPRQRLAKSPPRCRPLPLRTCWTSSAASGPSMRSRGLGLARRRPKCRRSTSRDRAVDFRRITADSSTPGRNSGTPCGRNSPVKPPGETPGETAAPEPPAATPRLRTIDQIMQEEGVGAEKAAAIQAQEVDALPNARPVTAEEVGARKAGVKTPPASPYVKVPPEPKRLIQFLKEKTVIGEGINQTTIPGGIRDDSGDILHIVGDHRSHPGLINNRTGRTLDDATLRAYEEGYFPNHSERPSIDDLLQAIGEDHRNNRQYSSQDMDRVTAYQNAVAHNAEIDRLESETGISPKGMTHDQFMQAVADHYGQFPGDLPEGSGTGPEPAERVTTADGEEIPWNERKLPLPPPEGGDLFGGQKAAPVARTPEPTIRTDPRQAVMPGMEGNAVQAQAARDAVPNVGRVPQVRPDEGLFARAETVQPELMATPAHGNAAADYAREAAGPNPRAAAANWVVERGKADGLEHLVGIDSKTGDTVVAQHGDKKAEVNMPASVLDAAMDPNNALEFHHNHPEDSPLSGNDLAQLAYPGVNRVVAHGHDGSVSAPLGLGRLWIAYLLSSSRTSSWRPTQG